MADNFILQERVIEIFSNKIPYRPREMREIEVADKVDRLRRRGLQLVAQPPH